jgi:hypothetical protein
MDTTSIVTTVQTISVTNEVYGKLTPVLWFLLYLGLFIYWLTKLNTIKKENIDKSVGQIFSIFGKDNWLEIPLSAIGCLVFAIFSDLPQSSMDSTAIMVMVFGTGLGGSSFINSLITQSKTKEGITSIVKPK